VTGERCARVLARMAEREHLAESLGASVNRTTLGTSSGSKPLRTASLPSSWNQRPSEPEAMDWLEVAGIPVISHKFAQTAAEAVQAAGRFDAAVAMKIVSPQVVHKTDLGGVALNLVTDHGIETAFSKMQGLVASESFDGVLITPMIDHPVEAIVGLSTDRQFGPSIAVGLGGIYTEIFKDLVLRVAPVSVDEARRMIEALKGIKILKGARGSVLRDIPALARLVSDVSQLPFRFGGIEELDLNPVFLFERGCVAGDARLIPTNGKTTQRSN
jgi:acetate---CoA ligase (ADP-forming)